jgi:hypothetical protein
MMHRHAVVHDRDRTTPQLANPLANVYERASVRINANVAAATHGVGAEILGSGDATRGYQASSYASRRYFCQRRYPQRLGRR